MIRNETYQDIQILQGHNFENIVTFDSTHVMSSTMSYVAIIVKDKTRSAFTGPDKTNNTDGIRASDDAWASASVTAIHCDIVADRSENTVNVKLPAEATQHFTDSFEGYWELLEKDTSTDPDTYVRQLQGDVVVSNSASLISDTFTASVA